MESQSVVLVSLAVLVSPIIGTLLAMTLGLVHTLKRRPRVTHVQRLNATRLDVLETRLREAAAMFGYRVDIDPPRVHDESALFAAPDVTDERRAGDRRRRVRRQRARATIERRRRERRQRASPLRETSRTRA